MSSITMVRCAGEDTMVGESNHGVCVAHHGMWVANHGDCNVVDGPWFAFGTTHAMVSCSYTMVAVCTPWVCLDMEKHHGKRGERRVYHGVSSITMVGVCR